MMSRHDQRQLGFSDRWFQLGLLTDEGLCALVSEYEESDDKNSEHYRYRVFRNYLSAHRPLPPETADALYQLGLEDPDQGMGGAMMHDIVGLTECPSGVLERASTSGEKHLVKAARQTRLLAELKAGLTVELFVRCLESGDAGVQRELLSKAELSRAQLEQLAAAGSSRAVRNVAAERLRGRGPAA
jgi:hypothetical protein